MQKIVNKKIISIVCSLLILMLIGYLTFNYVVIPAKAEEVTNEKVGKKRFNLAPGFRIYILEINSHGNAFIYIKSL